MNPPRTSSRWLRGLEPRPGRPARVGRKSFRRSGDHRGREVSGAPVPDGRVREPGVATRAGGRGPAVFAFARGQSPPGWETEKVTQLAQTGRSSRACSTDSVDARGRRVCGPTLGGGARGGGVRPRGSGDGGRARRPGDRGYSSGIGRGLGHRERRRLRHLEPLRPEHPVRDPACRLVEGARPRARPSRPSSAPSRGRRRSRRRGRLPIQKSASPDSPGPFTAQPRTATSKCLGVGRAAAPRRASARLLRRPTLSRPHDGHAISTGPRSRRPSAFSTSHATLTSFAGSAVRLTRTVSPMPSNEQGPESDGALDRAGRHGGPASVTPRWSGYGTLAESLR